MPRHRASNYHLSHLSSTRLQISCYFSHFTDAELRLRGQQNFWNSQSWNVKCRWPAIWFRFIWPTTLPLSACLGGRTLQKWRLSEINEVEPVLFCLSSWGQNRCLTYWNTFCSSWKKRYGPESSVSRWWQPDLGGPELQTDDTEKVPGTLPALLSEPSSF